MENGLHYLEKQLKFELEVLDSLEGRFKEKTLEDVENLKMEISLLRKQQPKILLYNRLNSDKAH
jgi:hypothetical protein